MTAVGVTTRRSSLTTLCEGGCGEDFGGIKSCQAPVRKADVGNQESGLEPRSERKPGKFESLDYGDHPGPGRV